MDRQSREQARRINEAAREFAEALRESMQTVSGRSNEVQERARMLTQSFFESVNRELETQALSSRTAAEELTEQARKQQEALRELSEESLNLYKNFLDQVTTYYQTNLEQAQASVQESTRMASESTQRASTSTLAAVEGHPGVPIAGYDELNVDEISSRLESLSEDELRSVRDYEVQNKNRRTIIEQIGRKL
ncbi:MAG: hypothetical protein ACFB50_06450 [Rubrobacteraceae bacterium]